MHPGARISFVSALLLVLGSNSGHAFDTVRLHGIWSFSRGDACSVFDPVHRRWFVFGGVSPNGGGSEMRMLDLDGAPAWGRVTTQGGSSPGDATGVAVYDSKRNRLLYFRPGSSQVYSLSLTPPYISSSFTTHGGGGGLYRMAGAYDPKRDRVVLVGGYIINPYQPAIFETRNNISILSLADTTWLPVSQLGTPPTARAGAVAAWDPKGDRMILHGGFVQDGFNPSEYLEDVYAFTYTSGIPTWTKLAPSGQAQSTYNVPAVFDTLFQRLVIPDRGRILELADSARWVQGPWTSSPYIVRGSVAAYDPAGQRVLWGTGIYRNAHGQEFPSGGIHQFPLGPVIVAGPGSPLTVAGEPGFVATLAGYDRVRHRFVGLSGSSPVVLTVADTTWAGAGETGSFTGPIKSLYDSGTNTLYAISPSDLYSIQPGPEATWSHSALAPPAPGAFGDYSTAFLDASRQCVIVIGAELWRLDLGPAPAWTKLADSTPLGPRNTVACVDLRRDRALFFGGNSPSGWQGDLWALDLATMTFTQPAATGSAPLPRPEVAAVYDSTRDRLVVTGDALAGTYDLQFGPGDANGRWIRNDPDGPSYPMPLLGGAAGYDAVRDRMYTSDATRVFEHSFGPYTPALVLSSSPPRTWTPATVMGVSFKIDIGVAGTHTFAWTLRSERAWPFMPLAGQVTYTTPGQKFVSANVAVPDTAATGTNTLRFEIHDIADMSIADSTTLLLASPLPTWTALTPTATYRSFAFGWRLSTEWWDPVRIERRPEGGTFTHLADVAVYGANIVSYYDSTVVPGARYGYRASLAGVAGTSTSPELVVAVPLLWTNGTAAAEGDTVRLAWHIGPGTDHTTARIERRPDAGTWSALADVPIAVDGTVAYVDASEMPDGRYGYRAGLPGEDDWALSQEILVDVSHPTVFPPPPGGVYVLAFATSGAVITQGAPQISFTVPQAGTVRLEAFDLAGRRVAARSLDAAAAGPITVGLDSGAAFRPGIYFLRLTQGTSSVRTRMVFVGGN